MVMILIFIWRNVMVIIEETIRMSVMVSIACLFFSRELGSGGEVDVVSH